MERIFENRATREYKESQEAKAESDDNFIDEDSDSQDFLRIVQGGRLLRRLRALIQFGSERGWYATDRLGREWAIDMDTETETWTLDLRDRHVRDIMHGMGWRREVPRR